MRTKKKFTVYMPCVYSEMYEVEATTEEAAIKAVRSSNGQG
jgi:hypothetical protein